MKVNVLYIDPIGVVGGSSRSLFEAAVAVSVDCVTPFFVTTKGSAANIFYSQITKDIITVRGFAKFDNTWYGYYRGARWLILFRELFYIPHTFLGIFLAKRKWKNISIIHVNEITGIFPGLIAKLLFRVPMVVHVRSLQCSNLKSWRSRFINFLLGHLVDAVIAIDESVRLTLPKDIPVFVIHNSFNTTKKTSAVDNNIISRIDNLSERSLKVGFVGSLYVSKGIFDLVESAKILRDSNCEVDFIVVGGHSRVDLGISGWLLRKLQLTQNLATELLAKIDEYGLSDSFHLLGVTDDIQSVYERIDVLCFPSYLDAPGRPIFEAAFCSVPSIACISKPMPDTFVPQQTGITVPPKDPHSLASVISYLADNRNEVTRMGECAKKLAEANFDPVINAHILCDVYKNIFK